MNTLGFDLAASCRDRPMAPLHHSPKCQLSITLYHYGAAMLVVSPKTLYQKPKCHKPYFFCCTAMHAVRLRHGRSTTVKRPCEWETLNIPEHITMHCSGDAPATRSAIMEECNVSDKGLSLSAVQQPP